MSRVRVFFARSFTVGQAAAWFGCALALLVLGAHFYRAGDYGIALCAGLGVLFLSLDSNWKRHAVGFFLLWGAVEWGESAFALARMRMMMGLPFVRAGIILCVVGLVTALAGLHVLGRARERSAEGSAERLQGLVFIAAFLALLYLRRAANLEFLLLERYLPAFGGVQIFFAAWYAAFVAGKLADPKTTRAARRILWLVFGLVFFAQFFLGLLGIEGMLLTGKLHVPIPAFIVFAPLFRESMSMMPFIAIACVLLTGGAWCSMLCYFGPFDALAAGNRAVRPPSRGLSLALRYGRQTALITGVLGALGLRAVGMSAESAVTLACVYGLASLAIMAVFSRRHHAMTHCSAFCPFGLLVNIAARATPWRLRVDTGRCDNCGACEKVCRYRAITGESRARGGTLWRCTLCRDCVGACPEGALSLRCARLSPEFSWRLFTGLVSVLHAVFLSVAMV